MGISLVLGFFDGIHLGHQAVINSARKVLSENKVIVLTFKDSPAKFFSKNEKYILSRECSIQKMKLLGVDEVVLQDFSEIYSKAAEEYLRHIIEAYSPVSISTGFNYTFGANKSGNVNLLKTCQAKFGYQYICVPPYKVNDEIVSSTLIKKYLRNGDIRKANALLGSNFNIEGAVKHGAQIGRSIGFPTANIDYPENIIEIPYGVYAVKIGENFGMMNYGIKPTVNGEKPLAEAHIFDFGKDIYGKNIRIEIIDSIRSERKFNNLDELKLQIQKDKEACLKSLL